MDCRHVSGPRGEGRLVLADGAVVEILFTNRALAEAETLIGKSVLRLADTARSNDLGMGDVAKLLYVGMAASQRDSGVGGLRIAMKDAWDVLDKVGFQRVAIVVMEALAVVLSYGTEEPAPEAAPDAPPDPPQRRAKN